MYTVQTPKLTMANGHRFKHEAEWKNYLTVTNFLQESVRIWDLQPNEPILSQLTIIK